MQPIRTCVACRKKFNQSELIKITLSKSGDYAINQSGASGRSNYVCHHHDCIELTITKKILNKKFKKEVPQEIYQSLTKLI